jgi:hypothetical protein
MNDREAAERDRILSEAMNQVARDEAAIREMEARRRPKSRHGLLMGAIVAFTLVVAWNGWMLLRPPRLPPVEQQICALMRTAGAIGEEVLAFRSSQRRLPGREELGHVLDDHLSYQRIGDGFSITHTDGRYAVTYDGSQPVSAWMAAAGCAVPGSAP